MTVNQLRAALIKYPDEMLVLVDGYEGGFDEINFCVERVKHCPSEHRWWDGDWQSADEGAESSVNALILSRG